MLEKKQLEKILSVCLETGGDFAEIFEERKVSNGYSLLNGKVDNANSGIVYGVGLRIYHNTESVYAYSNDTSLDNLLKMAKDLSGSIHDEVKDFNIELEDMFEGEYKSAAKKKIIIGC